MSTVRVLIVDDHPVVVDALERLLKTDPRLEVVARARSLAEAGPLLARTTPDVVLLDLRLLDSEGYDTIAAVRGFRRGARIVVLTGSSGVTEERALHSGADAYLDKSMESARIVDTLLKVAALDPGSPRPVEALSPRELEVARLVVEGLTNAEIGAALHISEHTVHTHVAHILAKLRLRNRTGLAGHWRQRT